MWIFIIALFLAVACVLAILTCGTGKTRQNQDEMARQHIKKREKETM